MLFQKLTRKFRLPALIVLSSLLTGCGGKSVTLYPVRDTDIRVEGDNVIISKWYFNEVLKVKLEEGR